MRHVQRQSRVPSLASIELLKKRLCKSQPLSTTAEFSTLAELNHNSTHCHYIRDVVGSFSTQANFFIQPHGRQILLPQHERLKIIKARLLATDVVRHKNCIKVRLHCGNDTITQARTTVSSRESCQEKRFKLRTVYDCRNV